MRPLPAYALIGLMAALSACQANTAPSNPLAGEWRLEDLNRAGVIDNSNVTLTLGADGRVFGNAGCNQYSGLYTLDDEEFSINPPIIATQRACVAEAMMRQEQSYLLTLPTMTKLATDFSGAMVLRDDKGNTLTFRKAE